jgi:hypothetical protein
LISILKKVKPEFTKTFWAVIEVPGVNEDKHAEVVGTSATIS